MARNAVRDVSVDGFDHAEAGEGVECDGVVMAYSERSIGGDFLDAGLEVGPGGGMDFWRSKLKVAPLYVLLGGGALRVVGIALMGFLSSPEGSVTPVQCCSQFITGFGFGFNSSTLIILLPLVIEKQDTGLPRSPPK